MKFQISELHEELQPYKVNDNVTWYKRLATGILTRDNGSTENLVRCELKSGKDKTIKGLSTGQEYVVEDMGKQGNNRVLKIAPKNQQAGGQSDGFGGGGGGRGYDSHGMRVGNCLTNAVALVVGTLPAELRPKTLEDSTKVANLCTRIADIFVRWSTEQQGEKPKDTKQPEAKKENPFLDQIEAILRRAEPYKITLEHFEKLVGKASNQWGKAEVDVAEFQMSRVEKGANPNVITGTGG